jgi:uncharacterized protein
MTTPRSALITGASSGLGALYADRLARRRYDVILVARDAGRLSGVASDISRGIGRSATVVAADPTDAADWQAYTTARLRLASGLSRDTPAPRYGVAAAGVAGA